MKNLHNWAIISLLIILPFFTQAAEFRAGEKITVPKDEAINDDLYAGGGEITLAGSLLGDFYAGGGNILINGPVRGDLVIAGGTVNILGDVGDDIRVGGGNILIQSKVSGDVLAGGGQINIAGGEIEGDVFIGGGMIRIDAPVKGDIRAGGGEIYINSSVGGNIFANTDRLTLGPKAVVKGDINYKSPREMVKEGGSQVLGKINFEERARGGRKVLVGIFTAALLLKFLMFLAFSLVFGYLFNRYSLELVRNSKMLPLKNLGVGALTLIVLPIASILLLASVIGVPFGVLGLIGFAVLIVWSIFISPIILGSFLYGLFKGGEEKIDWKTILLGSFVFAIMGFLPLVGSSAKFLLVLITLGASVRLKMKIAREWR